MAANPGASGSYTLSGSGYLSASAATEYIGNSGSGAFTQTGGTNIVGGGIIYLGSNPGSSGTYSLSGSGNFAISNGFEYIGNSGSGTFTQTGGTNNGGTSGVIYLGLNPGSSGAYSLSGSGLLTIPIQQIGYSGSGAFTQTGGTNNLGGGLLELGVNTLSSNGSYNLSGSGYLSAFQEFIGNPGSGTFVQSGGTNAIISTLSVGSGSGGSATYNLSGSGVLTAAFEKIGYGGSGSFTQSGGSHTVVTELDIGYSPSGSGTYSLSGGSLTTTFNLFVGNSGSGTFTQSGGVNSVTGVMYLAYGGAGSSYNLSGSGVLTAGTISLGSQATFTQSGGTVGPGTLLNAGTFSYSGGVFNARLVIGGTALFGRSFYAGQGIENDATFTVPAGIDVGANAGGPANTLDNEGTINLAGGTLAGGQSAGSGGPIVNNGLIIGYGGLSSGVGIINNAQITQSGGVLTISAGTSNMTNAGTIALVSGFQLRLTSGTLTNQGGTIDLNSSTLAGAGMLNNAGGNVAGPGTITASFQNSNGILSVPLGVTNITQPFINAGSIQLSGFTADLSGGSIANTGSIEGNGLVDNAVNNTGTIESINGTLTISGPLQNGAAGLLAVDAGSKLLVSSGLAANNGTINLTGGVFDNNSFALSNSAEISGYGTFRSGGLTNYNVITLTGATSTVNGPVTNASSGTINVSYNPAIFTGNVVNNGFVKSTSTTVTWAGGFTNNGTYHSDPAQNYFAGLANGATGLLLGGAGDGFFITGPLATNAGQIDLSGTSTMVVGNGAGVLTQSSGTLEIGTGAALSAGMVEIDGGILLADGPAAAITANLVYDSSSPSTYQGMLAGASNSLTLNNPAALLVLSGSNTYSGGTNVEAGRLVVTSPTAIRDGTNLTVGAAAAFAPTVPGSQDATTAATTSVVPEPGALALLAALFGAPALAGSWRRNRLKAGLQR